MSTEEDTGGEYQPLVRLEKVQVTTGEEEEDVVAKDRCKLYRFDSKVDDWKERGTGDVKLLKHKQTKKIRIIVRQEKTLKLVMNHYLNPEVEWKPNQGSDRAWTWTIADYAEPEKGPETSVFALKFRTPEAATEFKNLYDQYRKEMAALAPPSTAQPASSSSSASTSSSSSASTSSSPAPASSSSSSSSTSSSSSSSSSAPASSSSSSSASASSSSSSSSSSASTPAPASAPSSSSASSASSVSSSSSPSKPTVSPSNAAGTSSTAETAKSPSK